MKTLQPDLPKPTDAEMEILNVLWQLEPATVRTAGDDLPDRLGAGCERLVRDDEQAVGVAWILDRGGVVHGGSFRDGGPSAGRAPSVLRHAGNGL